MKNKYIFKKVLCEEWHHFTYFTSPADLLEAAGLTCLLLQSVCCNIIVFVEVYEKKLPHTDVQLEKGGSHRPPKRKSLYTIYITYKAYVLGNTPTKRVLELWTSASWRQVLKNEEEVYR